MKKLLLVLGLGFLLTGCNEQQAFLDNLSKITVEDLQGALSLATAANDKPAMQCYAGLIPIVQALPKQMPDLDILTGHPITDFEKARLLAKKVQTAGGADDQLIQNVNLACGALYMDAKGDVFRLIAKFRP